MNDDIIPTENEVERYVDSTEQQQPTQSVWTNSWNNYE